MEQKILNNLTRVCFYLISFLLWFKFVSIIYKFHFIENSQLITVIWAIFIFWYWYKKYERDKELEIIEKYSTEYEKIKDDLKKSKNSNNYYKLVNLFYKEYFLFSRWYITPNLWKEWEYWIKEDISYLISYDIQNLKNNKNYNIISSDIFTTYKIKESRNNNNNDFFLFIIEKLRIIQNELEKSEIMNNEKIDNFKKLKIDIIKKTIYILNER